MFNKAFNLSYNFDQRLSQINNKKLFRKKSYLHNNEP